MSWQANNATTEQEKRSIEGRSQDAYDLDKDVAPSGDAAASSGLNNETMMSSHRIMEPQEQLPHAQHMPSPSYVSSNSSGASAQEGITNYKASISTSPVMSTIDDVRQNVRKNSSDGPTSVDLMKIAPAHPFFNQPFYDSDGSDGSLVLSYKQKSTPSGSAAVPQTSSTSKRNERDRFPSFDSMASNGSIRYVSPNRASPVSHQPPTQLNPQLLPYHERRKLLQQRQNQRKPQQQQQQQPQQPQQQQPYQQQPQYQQPQHQQHQLPQEDSSSTRRHNPQFMFQQQNQFPHTMPSPEALAVYHQQMGYGVPMPPFVPPFPPPSQPGYLPHMQPYMTPMGMYPPTSSVQTQPQQPQPQPQQLQQPQPQPQLQPQPQPQPHLQSQQKPPPSQQQHVRLSPYRNLGKNELKNRPPSGMKNPGKNSRQQQQQQPQQSSPPIPHYQMNPHNPHSLPPSGMQRPPTSRASVPMNLEPAFSDSPPQSRRKRHSKQPSHNTSAHISSDLPPPPPPPLPSQYHFRDDSVGSVSSLGSYLGSRDEDEDHADQNPMQQPRATGFFDMIRQWSPRQGPAPTTVSDYHRKNQEFLHRSNRERQVVQKASPVQQQHKHRRMGSSDRPPPSRGTHKRLPSITNDDWDDMPNAHDDEQAAAATGSGGLSSADSGLSSSDTTDDETELGRRGQEPDERTSLLPPSGISSNERDGKTFHAEESHRRGRRGSRDKPHSSSRQRNAFAENQPTMRWDNRTAANMFEKARVPRKSRKKKLKARRLHRQVRHDSSDASDNSGSTDSSHDYRKWTRKRAKMLEKERVKLIEQWKAEARAEAELVRRKEEENYWHRRLGRYIDNKSRLIMGRAFKIFVGTEAFIANLPLTIGAVAMAVVTLGVVWFKFAEENLDSCEPVHFHSSQCTFPEFPGCFYCDRSARMYKVAVYFHFGCKGLAGFLAMIFIAKVLLATRVVLDEMSSPTTSSPAGLLCMTTVCVFAGRGVIGQVLVTLAATIHLGLVIWFIYMALAYHIMPEPSWFPNTVGIGLSAVKTWLYYPMPGHLLMAISLSLNFFFFPISLIRVAINQKISATVGWMQMSAPAISLYALTIMAQPSFEEEHPDVTRFQRVHRMVYLPCMHAMCVLSIIGFVASVHSLWTRWDDFRKKDFSPAHAAFCFPTLSHANAIQAYRGAINSFSDIRPGSWRMIILYTYWVIVLVGGTIATFWITAKFLYCLPRWTNLDVQDEEEPPAPYDTIMSLHHMVTAGETLRQPFVSPAVLQANETGALVATRGEDGTLRYVRTRLVPALGFEPTMNWSEMERERAVLLEWVGKNPPRRRHRTLSVPGIDFSYGYLGASNSGVYGAAGTEGGQETFVPGRRRADTGSPGLFS